jgi:hypothetical protein
MKIKGRQRRFDRSLGGSVFVVEAGACVRSSPVGVHGRGRAELPGPISARVVVVGCCRRRGVLVVSLLVGASR